MTKNIFLILTFFIFFSVHAQYEWTPAKVVLKNGSSFRGLVKFPLHSGGLISIGSTDFKYRKNRKSPRKKFGSDTVEEVIFGDEDFTTLHYVFVPIKKKKYVLMELVVRGKVNLYTRSVLKSHSMFNADPNFHSITTYYEDSQFYLKRNNEQIAKLISGPNSFGSFISRAKKYFSDCGKMFII